MQTVESQAKKVARPLERGVLVNNNQAAANGAWRNLGIGFGRAAPDGPAGRDYRVMLETVIQSHPKGVGLITVIQSTSTPTPEGRDAMVKMFRDLWPQLRGAAFVVEARGFSAATQRAVVSAFLMATRLGSRLKIFSSVEDATPWLASVLAEDNKDMTHDELSRVMFEVVKDFCHRHREPPGQ